MQKLFLILIATAVLSSCAKEELTAPCPNYGKYCHKEPVNGWNNTEEK